MFIRRTQIKSRQQGEPYFTYRLVESERVQGRMKQRILLNLGRHFEIPKSQWRALATRIEQLLEGQASLLSLELPTELESLAQRYAAQILASRCEETTGSGRFQSVDIDTLELPPLCHAVAATRERLQHLRASHPAVSLLVR